METYNAAVRAVEAYTTMNKWRLVLIT